jgi:hypothetical protein
MALAYIDPISGAFLLQLIVAGILGVGTFFRKRIFGSFKRLFGGKDSSEAQMVAESDASSDRVIDGNG